MKKAVCLCLVILMIVSICVACGNGELNETEPQDIKIFDLKDQKITAEYASCYDGGSQEYGDKVTVSDICNMKFTNTGEKTISEAQIIFSDGTQELSFWLEMLPAGQSVIVGGQNQLTVVAKDLRFVDSNITYLEEGLEKGDCVKVTDNKDGNVKIENVTGEMLPLVRVFYRPTDANGVALGGPCRSIMVDGIEAGSSVDVAAEDWDESCVVVTILIINE